MKFEHTRVWGFEHALRGMRNAKNSWDRADTEIHTDLDDTRALYFKDGFQMCPIDKDFAQFIKIGPNDMKLIQSLIRGGAEHRKFMRQIFVSVDITAPIYWWKEADTYKVGTVANSTSTMHTIEKSPITIENFEIDDYKDYCSFLPDFIGEEGLTADDCESMIMRFIDFLEGLRVKYLETKDKKYWKELIRWLPESWLQKRTITMTYENLFAMCSKGQRRFHKLNEWSGIDNPTLENFISWVRRLPYASEFIFLDELLDKSN